MRSENFASFWFVWSIPEKTCARLKTWLTKSLKLLPFVKTAFEQS